METKLRVPEARCRSREKSQNNIPAVRPAKAAALLAELVDAAPPKAKELADAGLLPDAIPLDPAGSSPGTADEHTAALAS